MKPKQIIFEGDSCDIHYHNGLRLHFWPREDQDAAYCCEMYKIPFRKAKIKVIFEFPEDIEETPLLLWDEEDLMVRYDLIDKGKAVNIAYD